MIDDWRIRIVKTVFTSSNTIVLTDGNVKLRLKYYDKYYNNY